MHLNKISLHPEKYPTDKYYPFNLKVFHQTKSMVFTSPVTFFVGENGTGKSTLLEAICIRCQIHIWRYNERTRFENNPYEKTFFRYLTVEWTDGQVPGSYFSSDIFRDFAQSLDEWAAADPGMLKYFGGKSLMTQSHGQSIMSLFKARYKIKGLYFLDEPETALSPRSQVQLLQLLEGMSRAGHAQFIIATHSPILLACPEATICSFDHIPVKTIKYEETEHYQIYKEFMENRTKYITHR
ncbi:MAG: AAA family ATPase [Deltaproteobacteria bacterium]|nr:AAA family ATPase [Deltaproteobacteria bacterium]